MPEEYTVIDEGDPEDNPELVTTFDDRGLAIQMAEEWQDEYGTEHSVSPVKQGEPADLEIDQ